MTAIAKVFTTGNSQAVRLPKAFRVSAREMWISKNEMTGEKIPLIPYMANKMIQVAVISSVYAIDHEKPETIANEFLRQGMEVASRIQLWAKYA